MRNILRAVLLAALSFPVAAAEARPAQPWPEALAWAANARQFFVAPDGKPGNAGTQAAPWDLASVFAGKGISPGDVVWLRGGLYLGAFASSLRGTEEKPVIVRAFPGERATLDGRDVAEGKGAFVFSARGSHTVYWGFEVTDSSAKPVKPGAFDVRGGEGNRFVNLIVHDGGGNGFWGGCLNNEIHGCLFYHNGLDGSKSPLGHELYTQNNDASKPKRISDSMFFNGYGFGIHAYSQSQGQLKGFQFVGNVWFGSCAAREEALHKDDCLIGTSNECTQLLLQENMSWARSPNERCTAIGRYGGNFHDVTIKDNYFYGQTKFEKEIPGLTVTGNTFCAAAGLDQAKFPQNTYLGSKPAQNKVFVRPNKYESKRAHLVVYNWEGLDAVAVDVSKVLEAGDAFEVRNAQNFFAQPVLSGACKGGALSIPLAGLEPAQPSGPGKIERSETTGKEFNVFVLLGGPSRLQSKGEAAK